MDRPISNSPAESGGPSAKRGHGSRRNIYPGFLRTVRRLVRGGSTPVNKGVSTDISTRMPQIDNRLLVGALGVAAVGAGAAFAAFRPDRTGGRTSRFLVLAHRILDETPVGAGPRLILRDLHVHEGFGKPTLVSVDVLVEGNTEKDTREEDGHKAVAEISPRIEGVFDRLIHAIWDNPEIAPVAIRGRIFEGVHRNTPPEETPIVDMTILGFDGEIARPADLYARYGPPASDLAWKP